MACLTVVAGPMFSGKTESLIKHVRTTRGRVVVYKPVTDTRHEAAAVISHNGSSVPAEWIARDAPDLPRDVALIAIDEIQFFSLDAVPRILDVVRSGVNVVVAGLDLTSKGEPFGPVPALMAYADSVVKLTSRCSKCNKPATRSHRRVVSTETVLIGGTEAYEPRCLACFDPRGGI